MENFDYEESQVPDSAEKALVRGVLEQALRDYFDHPRKASTEDAKQWVWDEDCSPGSFVWCCDMLGFNQEYLRNLISRKEETDALCNRVGGGGLIGYSGEDQTNWNIDE